MDYTVWIVVALCVMGAVFLWTLVKFPSPEERENRALRDEERRARDANKELAAREREHLPK